MASDLEWKMGRNMFVIVMAEKNGRLLELFSALRIHKY
jgi:hypothetical protein